MKDTEIIKALEHKAYLQKDIALKYAYLIIHNNYNDQPNWEKINKAIVNRWSKSGLKRVKELAWKIVNNP